MSIRMQDRITHLRTQLRHEPTEKRIRATLGGQVIIDTTNALLVWEPRRISPAYAVAAQEARADLVPVAPREPGGPELLHPGIYRQSLPDATQLTDLIAFYDDVMDVTVDGVRRQPADTAVAKALLDEFGV